MAACFECLSLRQVLEALASIELANRRLDTERLNVTQIRIHRTRPVLMLVCPVEQLQLLLLISKQLRVWTGTLFGKTFPDNARLWNTYETESSDFESILHQCAHALDQTIPDDWRQQLNAIVG